MLADLRNLFGNTISTIKVITMTLATCAFWHVRLYYLNSIRNLVQTRFIDKVFAKRLY